MNSILHRLQISTTRTFCILFLVSSALSVSAQGSVNEHSEGDSLYRLASDFSNANQLKRSIQYYDLAARAYLKNDDTVAYYRSRVRVGTEYGFLGSFDKAYHIFDSVTIAVKNRTQAGALYDVSKAHSTVLQYEGKFQEAMSKIEIASQSNYDKTTREGHARTAKLLYRKGFSQFQLKRFEEAIITMENSRAIFDSLDLKLDEAKVLTQMGSLKVQLLKADEALNYFEKTKEIYLKNPEETSAENLGSLNINMGEAYRNLGLLPEAINSLEAAVKQFQRISEDHQALTVIYPQLGYTYGLIEDHKKAIQYLKRSLQLSIGYYGKNNIRTITNQMILGKSYQKLSMFKEAILHYRDASKVLQTEMVGVAPDISAESTYLIGICLYNLGEENKGLRFMKEGIDKSMGKNIHLVRQVKLLTQGLAKVYLEANEPDSAIKYYQLSIDINTESVDHTKPNPQITYHFNRYESFLGKTASYDRMYKTDQKRQWLDSAYSMLALAEDEISSFREFPSRLTEQLKMGTKISESLSLGISICFDLFQLTTERKYAEYAYTLIEQSKSNQALFNSETNTRIDLPDSILVKEKKFNASLSSLETLLYRELQEEKPDTVKIIEYEKNIADATDGVIRLSQHIRKYYPGYFQLKYDREYLNIEQTQKKLLTKGQLLINYHYNDNELYVFELTKSKFSFSKRVMDQEFEPSLFQFIYLLKKPNTSKESLLNYVNLSKKLSKALLPNLDKKDINSVTIIPDGSLHLLPFETLLKELSKVPSSFRELPYLMRDFDFHYSTSSSLLAKQKEKKSRKNRAIAFAPSFSENSATSDSVRASFGNLASTKKEVENVAAYFDTDYFLDTAATEKTFRSLVKDYSIVHLASHGTLDPNNALYSRLLFSPFDTDSINDGFLNTREILGMSIPAEMVVLSACNTGSGDVLAGEGVISLANGFSYAGAKSVIMTLWTANDESTAKIMEVFYKNLASGKAKSYALRRAKLDYLENANSLSSHPYYWAHFVVNGNDSPIVKSGIAWYYWVLILLIAIGSVRLFMIKKKTVS